MFGLDTYLSGAIGLAAGVGFSYLVIVPLERHDARAGYVQEDRALAAEAKAAELARQVGAGQVVIDAYQVQLKNIRAKDAEDDAQFAKDRADFQSRLVAAGRACGLSADDLDWLHDKRPAPGGK